jgi:hypothetical protein
MQHCEQKGEIHPSKYYAIHTFIGKGWVAGKYK